MSNYRNNEASDSRDSYDKNVADDQIILQNLLQLQFIQNNI